MFNGVLHSTNLYDSDEMVGYRERAASLCLKQGNDEQVLLVTSSRDPNCWVIPGGGIEPNEDTSAAARREAFEEAGVRGNTEACLGNFIDTERKLRTCVFILRVNEELDDWEDSSRIGRRRHWFSLQEARAALLELKASQAYYIDSLSVLAMKKVVFVTENEEKYSEAKEILSSHFDVMFKPMSLVEIQGSSEDIVINKCKEAKEKLNVPFFVEDSSLCFNALNGLPGQYVKWFLEALGPSGLYKLVSAYEDKTAYAMCIVGYSDGQSDEIRLFHGRVDGKIVDPSGVHGFGWDACFLPDNSNESFAQMPKAKKCEISHRALALKNMCDAVIRSATGD
ncbi:Inosine triphosphate pyrophosphatase [Trichinella sp. T6]|nr:Inosine triphosphate pyrophosphatase [Trichinella sp. T6]